MSVDTDEKPARFILTGGHRHDAPQAPALLEGMNTRWAIADQGCGSNRIRHPIEEMEATAAIPPRKNRKETRS